MKRLILAFVVLSIVWFGSGCGYRLAGTGSSLIPDSVRNVHIPTFNNRTKRIQADHFVTRAVRDEFIRRSKLKLVNSQSQADAVLEGEITSFTVRPLSFSGDATANLFNVTIVLNVSFSEIKTNRVLFENKSISYSDSYEIDSADFFTQESETLEKIARKFAASVVTAILEDF